MPTPVVFDPVLGQQFIKYARLVAGRGYVHNTLGNMVMRAAHPDFAHGLAYTKHAEISLEEMELENIVITDVPTSRIVWGDHMTSVGHNLSREILRLRPDINATIHVHDDAIIALLGSGAPHRVQRAVARSALRAGQAGAFRAGPCRRRGRRQRRSRASSRTPMRSCWSATASPRWAAPSRRPITG